MEHPSVFNAVFKMTGKELQAYEDEWLRRYPGKREHYEEHIEPYTYPTYMLFCAPVTNQLLSFFKVITDLNNLKKIKTPEWVDVCECPECGLLVTTLIYEKCIKCWSLDLDE